LTPNFCFLSCAIPHPCGVKVRREVLRKNAIMYFNEDGFVLEFNVKKAKEKYYEHIESINSFVAEMREKRDLLDVISLSH
jgi:antirestriction protein